ncbi:MAG: glycerol-3-phosphate 1-O-acyltransferase PlsY [Thermomicrobiales bacterium]|nr:glycerol-3-phosphate 1-O-acyltransferase PlsY [Thermomicrobiales bacterium]
MGAILFIAAAYAAGAVPWGVVLGRVFAGTDIRDYGSQSTGTTNAQRVLGWPYAVAVFVLDFAKGLVPVLIARALDMDWWVIGAVGVATVAGHCWSIFIGFSGGKGMATGGGALAGMMPIVLLVLPVMILVVWATRYVSLASLTGTAIAVVVAVIAAATGREPAAVAVACAVVGAIIFIRHQGNIERLLAGNERRLGRKVSPS